MQHDLPAFIFGCETIKEFVHRVSDEDLDVKEEIVKLTRLMVEIAKYPFETIEQNYYVIGELHKAICALLELL